MATEKGKDWKGDEAQWVTLYRGLGLPEDAIKTYQELLEAEGRRGEFDFTAFTSTSIDKDTALKFAFQAGERKQRPVLFVLKAMHYEEN